MNVPEPLIRYFEDVLPLDVLENVVAAAEDLASSPNYWIKKDVILGSPQSLSPAELTIRMIYQRLQIDWLSDLAGAEYWVQVYQPGKGLDFHFDKDEALMKECSHMSHPHLSSILYLTGDKHQPRLGPTVIIDQRYDNATKSAHPENPGHCAFVWPQQNAVAVFDGALGHGVLESPAQGKRMTMLINWWRHQPEAVSEAPVKACRQVNGFSEIVETAKQEPPDSGALQSAKSAQERSVASVALPGAQEPTAITVDELVSNCSLQIVGEKSIAALDIRHEGFQLYPVPSEHSEQFSSLQTAAAFVSNELLESEQEENQ